MMKRGVWFTLFLLSLFIFLTSVYVFRVKNPFSNNPYFSILKFFIKATPITFVAGCPALLNFQQNSIIIAINKHFFDHLAIA